MPLGNIIKAGKKLYDAAQDMNEEPFIPSVGKRNFIPTTSTRVSAREAAAPSAPVMPSPEPKVKSKDNPMDMGRGMGGMLGGAIKAGSQRKRMLDDL